jgi:threonine dehydrogenase-like Zn-dependent dehydrogenase
MRAVTCRHGELAVAEVGDPRPGPGQVLLDVVRCGICGSDLHVRHAADEQAELLRETGYDDFMRADQPVVLGHELSGRVVDYGPACREDVEAGAAVVALPLLRGGGGIHPIGLSARAPGGYAERVVVEEALMLPVPNGLGAELAALTEPMAVAFHAVRRAEVRKRDVAVVVGCGPVGLAVIAVLKTRGVRTVVASDLSPGRRRLAEVAGADLVVDPEVTSPFATAKDHGHLTTFPEAAELGVGTTERLRRLPLVPWHGVWRAAERAGAADPKRPVVFECVGVPGMLDALIAQVPMWSRVVVVGVCMAPDVIRPVMAINKELDLRFVLAYTPLEFRDTLHLLAEGRLDPSPFVTGTVGLDGVDGAFDALADPEAHAKVLIDPRARCRARGVSERG